MGFEYNVAGLVLDNPFAAVVFLLPLVKLLALGIPFGVIAGKAGFSWMWGWAVAAAWVFPAFWPALTVIFGILPIEPMIAMAVSLLIGVTGLWAFAFTRWPIKAQ